MIQPTQTTNYSPNINALSAEEMWAENEVALLEELALSWESLQAVYDLNQDLNASPSSQNLLEKITERVAAAVGADTRAVLWLAAENNATLQPVTAVNTGILEPRAANYGIIGDVFTQNSSYFSNNCENSEKIGEKEFELHSAMRLIVLPVSTPLAKYGVLAVWKEEGAKDFDSRTTQLLDTLTVQAAMVIETDLLHRESIRNEKLKQEMEIGADIQQILLAENPPKGLKWAKIAALTVPSNQIDGDFYDFIEYDENCFDLIVGDVMGKGIPAALVGAATKSCFLRAVGQLQYAEKNASPEPKNIVGWVNEEMTDKLMQFESFITVCYARFDFAENCLTFVDGGHTKTIFYERKNAAISSLEGDNMPLGFSLRETYEERIQPFSEGDVFFFFSDGITETRNEEGEFFGDERLADFIKKSAHLEPQTLIDELLSELRRFSDAKTFADDLTCVAVRIEEETNSNFKRVWRQEIKSNLQELAKARRFVRQAVEVFSHEQIIDEAVAELELAANEALTNIIRHAHAEKLNSLIEISARYVEKDVIEIAFFYEGADFDPERVPAPLFDGSQTGGFGVYIIENSVDCVAYSRESDGRNRIVMTKKLEVKNKTLSK